LRQGLHPRLLLWLLVVLLPACSTVPKARVTDPGGELLYQAKHDSLSTVSSWSMTGRLAVSNERDGGSGHFNWVNQAGSSRMDFHGALGRGAWRLLADASGAELELADGSVKRAADIDQLIRDQVGWKIPADSLSWWVRGMVAPGAFQERVIDGAGNLGSLLQDGWTIEYGSYKDFEGISLPVKVTARQAEWKVKLVIKKWDLGAAND
jgi:outer membrane lipoprotein LolB